MSEEFRGTLQPTEGGDEIAVVGVWDHMPASAGRRLNWGGVISTASAWVGQESYKLVLDDGRTAMIVPTGVGTKDIAFGGDGIPPRASDG